MFCTKCGKEIGSDVCPYCGINSKNKTSIINNQNNKSNFKNTISKLLLVLLGAISLFWILGSIIMFSNSDQALSDRIGSGILFLVLAIIFMIPFFIIFNKYLKNTKADRIAEKTHKKLVQEEQMQLKYKEILEHKEKIKNLESENEAKEKYLDTILEKTQQNIENQQTSQPTQELMNPAEILLLKIDSVSTSGVYFENIACRLLESNGFKNVRNTPASTDYGKRT